MNNEERIAALEAETMVLRRYVRMLISLLPGNQDVTRVLADTVRTINLDAQNLPQDQREHWTSANAALGVLSIPRRGAEAGR